MAPRFTSATFVGREQAFGQLAVVLDAAADGHASTLLIAASGGMGVSRLLSEVRDRISTLPEPFSVLRGCAVPAPDAPYAPVLRAIAPLLSELDELELGRVLGTSAEHVLRLLPELATRPAAQALLPARPTVASPERRQARLLEAILGILGRAAERQPIVLVIEDLHHADAATRALVVFLGRTARQQRLAVIAAYQPDELTRSHPLSADLARIGEAPRPPRHLEIGPFGRDEMAGLIEGIEGERPSASALLLVAERSGGSPLVAEELIAARRELSSASLTGTFDDVVIARLALRSPECRRILRLLAPAGRPMCHEELAAVAAAFEAAADGRPPRSALGRRRGDGVLDADLLAGLEEAIEHGFLVESSAGIDFRHELIGRAVDADLLPLQRLRHHAALGAGFAALPVVATGHWVAAGLPARARAAALAAAAEARRVDAPRDELRLLELSLSLSDHADRPDAGETPDRDNSPAALQARAAEAAFGSGRAPRAAAFAEAAIARLDPARDRRELALLHDRLGRYRRSAGDQDGALVAHRRAVELVPPGDSPDRATVLASLAQVRMLGGTFSEAERFAREAIEVARACGEAGRSQLVHATTTLGVSLGWSDDPEAGVRLLLEAREMAQDIADVDEVFRVYANLTTVLDLVGRRAEAVSVAYEGIQAATRAGLEAVYGNFLRGNAAESLFLLGRWDESRTLSRAALDWSPAGVAFVNSVVNLAIVEIETGAGELAGHLLGQLLLELETVRDSQHAVPVYRAAASFALWRGDLVDARRAADRGWTLVRETEDWVLAAKMGATVAEVDAAIAVEAGRDRDLAALAGAREHVAGVIAEAERVVADAGVAGTVGSRREADAYLATARAHRRRVDGLDDPAGWDCVAQSWIGQSNPYETARARWRQAEATLASKSARAGRVGARAPLTEAVMTALTLGARPLLRELRDLAGRARIDLPVEVDAAFERQASGDHNGHDTTPSAEDKAGSSAVARTIAGAPAVARPNTFGLSRREREVLDLISEGRTNREIGQRLFISQKTVGVHVGNILTKLGVSGRVEAAAVAIRLGLGQ